MSERSLLRLAAVTTSVAALDQLAKLAVRASLAAGEQQHLGLGFALTRQTHVGAGSSGATFIVAGVFVLAGLLGASLDRPMLPTWLVGGLLLGGAVSSFIELVAAGSTLGWLELPLHAVVSPAYLAMLIGGTGLFFHIGQARRHALRSVVTNG